MTQQSTGEQKFKRAKEFNYVVTISLYGGDKGQQFVGKLNLGIDEMYVIALLGMVDAGAVPHPKCPPLEDVWSEFVDSSRRLVMEYSL